MTERETILIERTLKVRIASIFTLVICTATSVWAVATYANKVTTAVAHNTIELTKRGPRIKNLEVEQHKHEIRITKLEAKHE